MADLAEDTLTTLDDRDFWTDDAAVTITGDVTDVPTGFTELEEASAWNLEGTGATGDGQTRANRGHAKPVVTNKSHTVTFSLKPQVDTDPVVTHGLDVGKILRLLHVGSDGFYVSVLCQITRIRQTANIAELPAFEGTAEVREHPVRGQITTWPPAPPGP